MSEDTNNDDLGREEPADEHDEGEAQRGFTFEDMRLAVGDRLQIECTARTGVRRAFVRVVGYMDGVSLLVSTPVAGGRRVELVENDPVIVRVFSRESAFAFRASVLRACRLPFDYVHLSFPDRHPGQRDPQGDAGAHPVPGTGELERPAASRARAPC